jgi:hypothetical protein
MGTEDLRKYIAEAHHMVVCKFQCHDKGPRPEGNQDNGTCNVRMGAVWEGTTEKQQASENAIFGKWTPGGEVRLTLANPAAADLFVAGKKYYVAIVEAPAE